MYTARCCDHGNSGNHGNLSGEEHPELMSLQETKSSEDDLEQLEATAQSWNQLQRDIQVRTTTWQLTVT